MVRHGSTEAADAAFGQTIDDALRQFAQRGYTASLHIADKGRIACENCGVATAARDVPMDHMARIEGVSDPADEDLVAAVRCPACDVRGVIVTYYGPGVPAEQVEAVRDLGRSSAGTS